MRNIINNIVQTIKLSKSTVQACDMRKRKSKPTEHKSKRHKAQEYDQDDEKIHTHSELEIQNGPGETINPINCLLGSAIGNINSELDHVDNIPDINKNVFKSLRPKYRKTSKYKKKEKIQQHNQGGKDKIIDPMDGQMTQNAQTSDTNQQGTTQINKQNEQYLDPTVENQDMDGVMEENIEKINKIMGNIDFNEMYDRIQDTIEFIDCDTIDEQIEQHDNNQQSGFVMKQDVSIHKYDSLDQLLDDMEKNKENTITDKYDIRNALKIIFANLSDRIQDIEESDPNEFRLLDDFDDYLGDDKQYLIPLFNKIHSCTNFTNLLSRLGYYEEVQNIKLLLEFLKKASLNESNCENVTCYTNDYNSFSKSLREKIAENNSKNNITYEEKQLDNMDQVILFMRKVQKLILTMYMSINFFIEKFSSIISEEKMKRLFNLIIKKYDYYTVDKKTINEPVIDKMLSNDSANTIERYLKNIYSELISIEEAMSQSNHNLYDTVTRIKNLLYKGIKFTKFIKSMFDDVCRYEEMLKDIHEKHGTHMKSLLSELWKVCVNTYFSPYITLGLNTIEDCKKLLCHLKQIVAHVSKRIDIFKKSHPDVDQVHNLFNYTQQYISGNKIDNNTTTTTPIQKYGYEILNKLTEINQNMSKLKKKIINVPCGTCQIKDILSIEENFLNNIIYKTKTEKKYINISNFLQLQKSLAYNAHLLHEHVQSALRNKLNNSNKNLPLSNYEESMKIKITISNHRKNSKDVKYTYHNADGETKDVYINQHDSMSIDKVLQYHEQITENFIAEINVFIEKYKDHINPEDMKELFDFIIADCNVYDSCYDDIKKKILNRENNREYYVQDILSNLYKELEIIKPLDDTDQTHRQLNGFKEKYFTSFINPIVTLIIKDSKRLPRINTNINELFKTFGNHKLSHRLFMRLFVHSITITNIRRKDIWDNLSCENKYKLLKKSIMYPYKVIDDFIEENKNDPDTKQLISAIYYIFKKCQKIDMTTESCDYEILHRLKKVNYNLTEQSKNFDKNSINLECGTYQLKDVLGRDGRFLERIIYKTCSEAKYPTVLKFFKKQKLLNYISLFKKSTRSKLHNRRFELNKNAEYRWLEEKLGHKKIMAQTITISPLKRDNDVEYKYIDEYNKETTVYINKQDVELIKNILEYNNESITDLIELIEKFINENKGDISVEHMKELFDFITGDCNGYDIYDREIKEEINKPEQNYHVLQILSDIYKAMDDIDKIDDIQDKEDALDQLRGEKFTPLITPICWLRYRTKIKSQVTERIENLFTKGKHNKKLVVKLFTQLFVLPIENNEKTLRYLNDTYLWKKLDFEVKNILLKTATLSIYTELKNFIEQNEKSTEVILEISSILKEEEDEINKSTTKKLESQDSFLLIRSRKKRKRTAANR